MLTAVPDRKRVFQTAAWMWLVYLAALALIDAFIYANRPFLPIVWYHIINALPALAFFGLARTRWASRRPNEMAPLLVAMITAGPILANHLFDLRLPPAPLSNVEGMVLRQLPILFIGLILVAWHYDLLIMLLYTLATNFMELALVYGLGLMEDARLSAFYFIIVIRTVCFVVIGVFINQLVTRLREQQESLQAANSQLTHFASTLESLTVSRERNRMSRELHDTVVHTLSGLSVQLETTRAYWDVDDGTARGLLAQALETTRTGLQETRRALKALRASPLEDLGLVLALRQLADAAAERGKLAVKVELPEGPLLLSPDVEQCLYRITQEAVENVLHHANAQHLVLHLALSPAEICLVIWDDGIGFHPEAHLPAGHFGLQGMRERAALVGGELNIESHPGQPRAAFNPAVAEVPPWGTTIRLSIKGRAA